nr:MAG TPA: hypothetical protein [Caudoviricetes sp.]
MLLVPYLYCSKKYLVIKIFFSNRFDRNRI